MSVISRIIDKNLTPPNTFPGFVKTNLIYECIMGSMAYAVNTDDSDMDIYGVVIPPKEYVFPHSAGYIHGFDENVPTYKNQSIHHIDDAEKNRQYDVNLFGIVNYVNLLMDNNPNMIDSLFVPARCITQITTIGQILRDNRKAFLHKGAKFRFMGYSFAQMKKIKSKDPVGKRAEIVEKYGFDVKFAYHLVRLVSECEQILETHNLDLEKDNERLKAIRRGDYSLERIEQFFQEKEIYMEELYEKSTLPHSPDISRIKLILLSCLESHYGTLDKLIRRDDKSSQIISEIEVILNKYR
jgi:predicted nucleotidyltransferase